MQSFDVLRHFSFLLTFLRFTLLNELVDLRLHKRALEAPGGSEVSFITCYTNAQKKELSLRT